MIENPSHPRTGHLVAGSVGVLIAAVLIAAGAFALWGDSKKGADGYLSTGTERFITAIPYSTKWIIRSSTSTGTSCSNVPVMGHG